VLNAAESAEQPEAVIVASGVSKSYGSVQALTDVSLQVRAGETVALLGPNGAGKTTLVETLLALRSPDQGRARLFGRAAGESGASGRVGAMLQFSGLPALVTVRETLRLFAALQPTSLSFDETVSLAALGELLESRVDRLSGGQRQRVRFALAIAGDPDVVFLDEPTVGMDVQSRLHFWATMRAWSSAGKTVLFATHYLDEVNTAADRVVLLSRGRVVADTTPAELRALGAGTTVRFHLDDPTQRQQLEGLAGVTAVDCSSGTTVILHTTDADATVAGLYQHGIALSRLEVTRGSLDEAFVELTR